MGRRPTDEADERTPEVTGEDASMDQAEIGDAGNGADPFGADLTGGPPEPLEADPADPSDILPDELKTLQHQGDRDRDVPVEAEPRHESLIPLRRGLHLRRR
jgi:hypothetical protein